MKFLGLILLGQFLISCTCQSQSHVRKVTRYKPVSTLHFGQRISLKSSIIKEEEKPSINTPIRPSLFPNVPPYLRFFLSTDKVDPLPRRVRNHLTWRVAHTKSRVIIRTAVNSGLKLVHKNNNWTYLWDKYVLRSNFYSTLKPYHKVNQLIGSGQFCNKDQLWKHVNRSISLYGKKRFGFVPQTFILPNDMDRLKVAWTRAEGNGKRMWFVKPPRKANGNGIYVISNWDQVPKSSNRMTIVQEYIKPLLIKNRKFDLRLYVLVTSFHPLRAYLYQDGFVRFAALPYSNNTSNADQLTMHLTNLAINKKSEAYIKNNDINSYDGNQCWFVGGEKLYIHVGGESPLDGKDFNIVEKLEKFKEILWSVQAFWRHLSSLGKETKPIVKKIEDVVLKTLISAEKDVLNFNHILPNRQSAYQLYGFDIGLDEKLNPWLFEVNSSPGMSTESGFLSTLKRKLVQEYFNIVGYHFPPTLSKKAKKDLTDRLGVNVTLDQVTFDQRLYTSFKSAEEEEKHKFFTEKIDGKMQNWDKILDTLTPDDVRQLITAEDELSQCNGFVRIFPAKKSGRYLKYFAEPRYYNLLLNAWEEKYGQDRTIGIEKLKELCAAKLHLNLN